MTSTPRTPAQRRLSPWLFVVVAAVCLPLLAIGGTVTYYVVSGKPFLDEWQCSQGEAPVDTGEGGSYCAPDGASLPAGDTWHPLGNRPLECTDRWGWEAVETIEVDPLTTERESGCLKEGRDLPEGWRPVDQ